MVKSTANTCVRGVVRLTRISVLQWSLRLDFEAERGARIFQAPRGIGIKTAQPRTAATAGGPRLGPDNLRSIRHDHPQLAMRSGT